MVINYEAVTLSNLKDFQNISTFNAIANKEKDKRKYYKEFIPFVSATYQSPNVIKNNTLITEAFKYESRFLLWAILRYTLGNDKRRRILQAAIFNFNNKTANQTETNGEKFKTCIDIFKVLNLLKDDDSKQTYLEYFKAQGEKMQDIIKKEKAHCKKYPNSKGCEIYRSNYINPKFSLF